MNPFFSLSSSFYVLIVFMAAGSAVYPIIADAAETSGAVAPQTAVAIAPLDVEPKTGIARQLRALQLVQDRMVGGSLKAVDAQRAIMEQMVLDLETRQGLAGLTQVDAALLLPLALLNGADPQRIRSILGQSGVTITDAFLPGALAYAEGRVSIGLRAFENVDASVLPPLARAQFYLTFGVMQTKSDPEKASANFAKARLAAPGTLIEEAALRREALLHISNPVAFLKLVRTYLNRFAASPFASAFISQFAFSISSLEVEVQNQISAELDDLLAPAHAKDKQTFYTILARASLIGGNRELTDFATMRALRELKNPSQLLSARLYRAAFEIAGSGYRQAAIELQSLTRVPLQANDREILKAAISIAQELRRWPFGDDQVSRESVVDAKADQTSAAAPNDFSSGILEAQKLLDETGRLTVPTL